MIGGVTRQGVPPNTWTRVTSIQTGTYSASIGDCVQYDASSLSPTINLPAITAANKGGRICITSPDATNTNGVTTSPAGANTVVGIAAGDDPGFIGPMFSLTLVSDGGNNWDIESTGSF